MISGDMVTLAKLQKGVQPAEWYSMDEVAYHLGIPRQGLKKCPFTDADWVPQGRRKFMCGQTILDFFEKRRRDHELKIRLEQASLAEQEDIAYAHGRKPVAVHPRNRPQIATPDVGEDVATALGMIR